MCLGTSHPCLPTPLPRHLNFHPGHPLLLLRHMINDAGQKMQGKINVDKWAEKTWSINSFSLPLVDYLLDNSFMEPLWGHTFSLWKLWASVTYSFASVHHSSLSQMPLFGPKKAAHISFCSGSIFPGNKN